MTHEQTTHEQEVNVYLHADSEDSPLLEDAPPPGRTGSLHGEVAEHGVGLGGVAGVPENRQTLPDHKVDALRALGVLVSGAQAVSLEVLHDPVQGLSLQELVDSTSDAGCAVLAGHGALGWLVADGVAHPLRLWTARVKDLT